MEAAVTLPLLVLLVFGSIELANAVFLKQSINIAAYEAARIVTRPGDNEAQARVRAQEILAARKVGTYTITFDPSNASQRGAGDAVKVTITAPSSNLSYGPLRFMAGKSSHAAVTMVKLWHRVKQCESQDESRAPGIQLNGQVQHTF